MDSKNIEILKILQEKARIPNIEVSRMINLAPSAVLERIRKMEQQGIIERYEVRLNPKQFQCQQVSFIHVRIESNGDSSDICSSLASIPQIQEIHFIAGEDCILLKVRTGDTIELDQLLRSEILAIEGIRSTKTFPVLSTTKETAQIPIKTSKE